MELKDLHWFLTLAKHRHYGRAATELGVTQPALSQRMLKLEQQFLTKLVLRRPGRPKPERRPATDVGKDGEEHYGSKLAPPGAGHHLVLTGAGEELRASASRIMQELRHLSAAVLDARDAGYIFMPVGHTPGHREAVLAAVAAVTQQNVSLHFKVEQYSDDVVEERVRDGRLTVGLISALPTIEGLCYQHLADTPLRLVVNKAHRLAKVNAVQKLGELTRDRFALLSHPRPERLDVDRYFEAHGFIPNVAVETNVLGTVLAIVRRSSLVTALHAPAHLTELRGLALVNLPDCTAKQPSYLIWPNRSLLPHSREAELLMEELRAHLGGGSPRVHLSGSRRGP